MNNIKKTTDVIKDIFIKTCVMFTLTTLVFTIVAYAMMKSLSTNFSYFLYILLFSLMMSLSSLIFKIKALPGSAVWILHFILSYISFAVSFFLVGQIISTSKTILFMSVGFIPLYIIFSLAFFLFNKLGQVLSNKQKAYDNQFNSINK